MRAKRAPLSGQDKRALFRRYLTERGLKATSQRAVIVDVFLATHQHVSTDELYRMVSARDPRIGYATVYRTLKLLKECGLASDRQFGGRFTRYEQTSAGEHHDHMICTQCGAMVEFTHARMEQLQEAVARQHGYVVVRHTLELYGLCPRCRGAGSPPVPP